MAAGDKTYVRRYAADDIPRIIEICTAEIPKLPNYKGVVVDPSRIKFMLDQNVDNDGYFMIWLLEDDHGKIVGGIGAYCVTMAFSWARVCNDMFFFIEPEYRSLPNALKLMTAYRDWAIARKATIIGATHTGGGNENGMDKLIRMVGFEPIGKLYHYRPDYKRLTQTRSDSDVSTQHASGQQRAS
jgi:GNAT superfamily N-acetyltransferase